jgi:hypothetical protein
VTGVRIVAAEPLFGADDPNQELSRLREELGRRIMVRSFPNGSYPRLGVPRELLRAIIIDQYEADESSKKLGVW